MRDTIRDRGHFWRPAAAPADIIPHHDFEARFVTGLGQTLVTGNLDAAKAVHAPEARETGLWAAAGEGECWVRIARDRALLVSRQPVPIEAGWREDYAATPCDDAYAVIELAGDDLPRLIAEASSVDLEGGSRSASILFAGVTVLLYRTSGDTARLHVESPLSTYVWTWLADRR